MCRSSLLVTLQHSSLHLYRKIKSFILQGQKLSQDQKIATFLTKTFSNSNFWDKFRVKNFRENQKTLHFERKKLSRMATIFFFFFFLFLSSRSLQILKKVQARHEVLQLRFLPFRVRFVICCCVIIFWSQLITT